MNVRWLHAPVTTFVCPRLWLRQRILFVSPVSLNIQWYRRCREVLILFIYDCSSKIFGSSRYDYSDHPGMTIQTPGRSLSHRPPISLSVFKGNCQGWWRLVVTSSAAATPGARGWITQIAVPTALVHKCCHLAGPELSRLPINMSPSENAVF